MKFIDRVDEIFEMSKEMHKIGSIPAQIIYPDGKDFSVIMLVFRNQEEKNQAKKAIRELIDKFNIEEYFFLCETWISIQREGKKLYRAPSRDVERREAITLQYISRKKMRSWLLQFERKDDKIIYEKQQELKGTGMMSAWNVFESSEKYNQAMQKTVDALNNEFIREKTRDIVIKYKKKLAESKSIDEANAILEEFAREVDKKLEEAISEQKKTMFEKEEET